MMRNICSCLLLCVVTMPLAANGFDLGRTARGISLFDHGEPSRLAYGQLMEDGGHDTRDQFFGAGVALGFAGDPIGLGLSGWFDYYFTPWIAISARSSLAFGIVTEPHRDGGTGVDYGLGLGAKFVFDFPEWEWARWCRPFVCLYPVGFRFQGATEEFEVPPGRPGAGDTDEITYGDVFYLITWGGGCDFFLTSNVGLGLGLYIEGTVGGSRHRKSGINVRTRGDVDVYFEYFRLALRF